MSKEIIADIIKFLCDDRVDLRSAACSTVAELTGTDDGLNLVLNEESLLHFLLKLIRDVNEGVAKDALNVLINVSSEERGAYALFAINGIDAVQLFVDCVQDAEYALADYVCSVLANMTHSLLLCPQVLNRINKLPSKFEGLVDVICQIGYNKKGANLDILTRLLPNLTQSKEGRSEILDKEKCLFERILPFIGYSNSKERRKSVISTVHNCCFEKDYHEWFLSEEIDLASRLAFPLAGPDAFTPEENDLLPLDLQYLPENKLREECAELRALILESFMQLCTMRRSRERLRELNIYLILREHHKWEKEQTCLVLNENVVNFLIRTEEEIGEADLSTVEVPEDLVRNFTEFDEKILKENDTI